MSIPSLRNRINRLTVQSLAIVGSIAILMIFGYYNFKLTIYKESQVELLTKAIKYQVQEILPTLLLPEQREGLSIILDRIKVDEELEKIGFEENLKENILRNINQSCKEWTNQIICFSDQNLQVSIPIDLGSKPLGVLIKTKKLDMSQMKMQSAYIAETLIVFLGLAFLVQFIGLSKITKTEVPQSLHSLKYWIQKSLNNDHSDGPKPDLKFMELNDLAEEISALLKESRKNKIEAETASLARQVAHDIRSPLSALQAATSNLQPETPLSEDRQALIRNATERINAIAEDLLEKSRQPASSLKSEHEQEQAQIDVSTFDLAQTLTSSINEKQIEHQDKGIAIHLDLSELPPAAFAIGNKTDFARILSNLINNSVEATLALKPEATLAARSAHAPTVDPSQSSIKISAQALNSKWFNIAITDQGIGIPAEVLSRIGTEGFSFGKDSHGKASSAHASAAHATTQRSGSGLGVYFAKQKLSEWGGDLSIYSREGQGTMVVLKLAATQSFR